MPLRNIESREDREEVRGSEITVWERGTARAEKKEREFEMQGEVAKEDEEKWLAEAIAGLQQNAFYMRRALV